MKRCILALALVLVALSFGFAIKYDAPVHFYEPANLGLYLPPDTEIDEETDDGIWHAATEEGGFELFFQEAEEFIDRDDIDEEALELAFEGAEIDDFTFLEVKETDELTYAYGQGTTTTDDGETLEGMFGILTNDDAPEQTFMFIILAESLIDEDTGPAVEDLLDNIISMAPID